MTDLAKRPEGSHYSLLSLVTMLGFREVPSTKNEPSFHTEFSGTLIFTFTASRIISRVYK